MVVSRRKYRPMLARAAYHRNGRGVAPAACTTMKPQRCEREQPMHGLTGSRTGCLRPWCSEAASRRMTSGCPRRSAMRRSSHWSLPTGIDPPWPRMVQPTHHPAHGERARLVQPAAHGPDPRALRPARAALRQPVNPGDPRHHPTASGPAGAARRLGLAVRAWVPHVGQPDRAGYLAMGCAEILLHTDDITPEPRAGIFGPDALCRHLVRRLFPWAPTTHDVDGLVPAPLGDRPPDLPDMGASRPTGPGTPRQSRSGTARSRPARATLPHPPE